MNGAGQLALLFYVAAGGAFGSVCRYLMVRWIGQMAGREFPYGTLAVNILGSLLMGLVVALTVSMLPRGKELYLLLGVGALGGFTTFSAFSYETYILAERGQYALALAYVSGSVICGTCAFFVGMWAFKAFTA